MVAMKPYEDLSETGGEQFPESVQTVTWTEGGTDQWIYKKIAEDTKGRKRTGKEV